MAVSKGRLTVSLGALAVLLLPMTGEASDGGVQQHRNSMAPTTAPGAFLGPLPSSEGGRNTERGPHYSLAPQPGGGALYDSPEFSAMVAPDGTVTFHDHRIRFQPRDDQLRFDLTDEFSRELGHGTLYRHQKANFLAATFRERTDMAARAQAARMRVALQEIPARLDALWADTRYRRRERRRVIFLLWAEADRASSGSPPARAVIEKWIRRRLPAGSPDAYSKSELEALSRDRPDLPPFAPYAGSLEMRSPR